MNESIVLDSISENWGISYSHVFCSKVSPIEWCLEKDGRIACVVELKTRKIPSTRWDTVFLSNRKRHNLFYAAKGLHCAPIFMVKWSDGVIKWINVLDVLELPMSLQGRPPRYGSVNDIEQIVDVPIDKMRDLYEVPDFGYTANSIVMNQGIYDKLSIW